MRKTPLERTSTLKRGRRKPRVTPGGFKPHQFRQAAQMQIACAVTGSTGPWDAHHVIESQEVGRRGGDRYEPRNALRLSYLAHNQHTSAMRSVRLTELRDENVDYAFELMGPAAYPYLIRMYDGTDVRVERAIAELES